MLFYDNNYIINLYYNYFYGLNNKQIYHLLHGGQILVTVTPSGDQIVINTEYYEIIKEYYL